MKISSFFTALWTFFNLPSLELYWWSFFDRDMDWRMCPSTSWQRHTKLWQEKRLIENVMAFSCDHSGASTYSLSHGLITHLALPDGRPAWFCPSKSIRGRKDISPLVRGTINNAQPKKRAATCAWEECAGIEANCIAIVMRLCFLPGWPITAFSCNTRKMM